MKYRILITIALTVVFTAIDQFSKYFANIYISSPIKVIDNFLILEKSQNRGFAFGIELIPQIGLLVLTAVLILIIIHLVYKEVNLKKISAVFVVSLILGGAFGNLVDRVFRGSVTDFISFKFWPVFNLADVFIVIGVIIGIIFYKRILKVNRE